MLILAQFFIGVYNANSTVLNSYIIYSSKVTQHIRIVQLSDIHISSFTSVSSLENTVNRINELNPDIITITGDTIDFQLEPYIDKNINEVMGKFTAKYGTYIVNGNHEYYGGEINSISDEYAKVLNILRDDTVYIDDINVLIIGRKDINELYYDGFRIPISELLSEIDHDKYILVLDHQPHKDIINEAKCNHIDLQLSGHTHNGQFFPINLIVKAIYPNSFGILSDGDFNLIVSCGYGTWGPPIRTFSRSEVVIIDIFPK